ncbi:hypothetical protein F909_00963 [Acinetobacter sp. ANC 3929]|uniref:hypothetical protein n=1 Tax=Acinetobacter sp. ANC 3929 TaxID=1217707 RepID=UPI0002CFBBBA|nr:hypothetical protein [Acinetobacter sp. ANC 3929]ENW82692.1 hypothetical protein F909_00963 [Acinetobacter sp. ANC 3929]
MAIREGTTPPADLTLFVDGVNQNDKPPLTWLSEQVLEENFPFPVPAGFQVGQGVMQWTNNDELNHRIELVSNNSDIILLAYDNPTVTELDNTPMHIGVCLSAASQNGSEQATSTIRLYDQHFLRGNVQVEIGSISALYEWSPGNDWAFLEWFNVNFFNYAQITDAISDDANYAFTFETKASSNILVKMTTMTTGTLINQDVEIENGNKSFSQIGKVATFWLTPKINQISQLNTTFDEVNGDVVITGSTFHPNREISLHLLMVDFVYDGVIINTDNNGNFNFRVQTFKRVGVYTVQAVDSLTNERKEVLIDVKSSSDHLVPPELTVTGPKTFNANARGGNYVKQDIYYSIGLPFNTLDVFEVAQFKATLDGFSSGDFSIEANSGQRIYIASIKVFSQWSDPNLIDIIEYVVP